MVFMAPWFSWSSHSKYTGVVCHSLYQSLVRTLHYDLSILGGLHGMAHSFIELHKPLCRDKAVVHEGVDLNGKEIQKGEYM